MADTTAPLLMACAWSRCSNQPDMGEIPLCFEHYYQVVNHWRKPAERKAKAKADAVGKLERGETLAPDDPVPGWLYYIEVGDLIKIGYAGNLRSRLPAYPPNANLLAVEPGTRKLERERHQRFSAFLAEGREWYRHNDELSAWISEVVERHGDPEPHAYRPRKTGDRRPVRAAKGGRIV